MGRMFSLTVIDDAVVTKHAGDAGVLSFERVHDGGAKCRA